MLTADNSKAIQEKIIKDAKLEAADLLNAAKKEAAQKLAVAKEQLEQEMEVRLAASHASLMREAEQLQQIKRNEQKKTILEAKQNVISDVFESAYARLSKMNATNLDKLVESLVKEHASLGDTVEKTHDGVVISNSIYEIKITIKDLLNNLRDEIEGEVAKILFGGL